MGQLGRAIRRIREETEKPVRVLRRAYKLCVALAGIFGLSSLAAFLKSSLMLGIILLLVALIFVLGYVLFHWAWMAAAFDARPVDEYVGPGPTGDEDEFDVGLSVRNEGQKGWFRTSIIRITGLVDSHYPPGAEPVEWSGIADSDRCEIGRGEPPRHVRFMTIRMAENGVIGIRGFQHHQGQVHGHFHNPQAITSGTCALVVLYEIRDVELDQAMEAELVIPIDQQHSRVGQPYSRSRRL